MKWLWSICMAGGPVLGAIGAGLADNYLAMVWAIGAGVNGLLVVGFSSIVDDWKGIAESYRDMVLPSEGLTWTKTKQHGGKPRCWRNTKRSSVAVGMTTSTNC